MSFDCEVKVVDMIMGAGKSSAAINYMNSSKDEKFLYITPFVDEIQRIVNGCPNKHFVSPEKRFKTDTKLRNIKWLVNKGYNIASTHALFHRFDSEMIDLCRNGNYTLIMDEVTDVVAEYDLSKQDFDLLLDKYIYIEEDTHLIKWKPEMDDYNGRFVEEKRLCDMNCLAYYGSSIMMWLFPIGVFNAFRKVYILTYMFEAQIQKYYYDYHKLPYEYIYVKGDSVDEYEFTPEPVHGKIKYNYKELVHIENNSKLNMIGDREHDLSMTWYKRNADNVVLKQLQKNLLNYFTNICKAKSSQILWTTFKPYVSKLKAKGYAKSYLAHNARAVNEYGTRTHIAYAVNKFMHPYVKNFFITNNVEVDEDGYALSEMLQFIWRSAIRRGEEIWIYIPSIRMRKLFEQWIVNNTPTE